MQIRKNNEGVMMGMSKPVTVRKNGSVYIPYRIWRPAADFCEVTWQRSNDTVTITITADEEKQRKIETQPSGSAIWITSLVRHLGLETPQRSFEVTVDGDVLQVIFPIPAKKDLQQEV